MNNQPSNSAEYSQNISQQAQELLDQIENILTTNFAKEPLRYLNSHFIEILDYQISIYSDQPELAWQNFIISIVELYFPPHTSNRLAAQLPNLRSLQLITALIVQQVKQNPDLEEILIENQTYRNFDHFQIKNFCNEVINFFEIE